MEAQAPAQRVPPTDRRSGQYQEIIVAGKGWSERQHKGTNHGSTRTGVEHKISRSRGLPHQQDPRCRLCKDAPETVQHETAARV